MGEQDNSKSADARRAAWLETAHTLTEALPNILRYDDQTVVIKFGGHAMGDPDLARQFARDVVLLKQIGVHPVIVHGGGPQIGAMLDRLKIQSEFVQGLRVTDRATVDVVEMVLAGHINKGIVASITGVGGRAVGISGKDGGLITARKIHRTVRDPESQIEKVLDLGFVGEPSKVKPAVIEAITGGDLIPVIAPIGMGEEGETYNINADTAAGAIAAALGAKRLLLLTDVAGVMDEAGTVLPELSAEKAQALQDAGTIKGGMIPKVETCLSAISQGVEAAVILDGRVPHAVLLELFTEHGAGTLIGSLGASSA